MRAEGRCFSYGEAELAHLRAADPILGQAIDAIGPVERTVTPDLFTALVNSVVGQQISNKALATVWGRMEERFDITPQALAAADPAEIQRCGMSMRKAAAIRSIAGEVAGGRVVLEGLEALPDEEIIRRLSSLKGVGVWTAEMLLIFSLERPNVMSWNDLALHRGLRMLYHHRKITPRLFEKYRRRYSPYATVASLYLWAVAAGAIPGMKDYAPKGKKQENTKGHAP